MTENFIKGKTVGFYIGITSSVLAVVSLLLYLINGSALRQNNLFVILPLIILVVLEIISMKTEHDYLMIAISVCGTIALSAFAVDSVGTLVDYFFNLTMFGNVATIGTVAALLILMGIMVVATWIESFMCKEK